jgi:hypothetical protein
MPRSRYRRSSERAGAVRHVSHAARKVAVGRGSHRFRAFAPVSTIWAVTHA